MLPDGLSSRFPIQGFPVKEKTEVLALPLEKISNVMIVGLLDDVLMKAIVDHRFIRRSLGQTISIEYLSDIVGD